MAEAQAQLPLAELVSLHQRVAVITGAARGIGSAIAFRLAEAGANLFLLDRDEKALAQTVSQVARFSHKPRTAVLDLTDSAALQAAADQAVAQHGAIDIWVNNAGISPRVGALDVTDEEWDAVLDLN